MIAAKTVIVQTQKVHSDVPVRPVTKETAKRVLVRKLYILLFKFHNKTWNVRKPNLFKSQ